ncbi:MAG: hypothetical protein HY746_05015 [Elusimicrobia bacterium]|nr:hypothetical protein [Elusimicrobiota bacterium]
MSETWLIIGGWVAAGLTIFIFSFLYKDNPFFKIAEHLYLGAGMGWWFQVMFYNIWKPKVWEPVKILVNGLQIIQSYHIWKPEFWKAVWTAGDWTIFIPTLLGLSLITQFFQKISWVSRYGFTFIMGYGAGLVIPVSVSTDFMTQILGTIKPLFKVGTEMSWASFFYTFNTFLIAFGLVCVLIYFFFSAEQKGLVKKASNIGIYFLMLYFGAAFGNTVMGRFSLLYGRFDDLYKYSSVKYFYAAQIIAAALAVYFILNHFISAKKSRAAQDNSGS